MRSLEVAHPGFEADLKLDKFAALERLGRGTRGNCLLDCPCLVGPDRFVVRRSTDFRRAGLCRSDDGSNNGSRSGLGVWDAARVFHNLRNERLAGEGESVEKATRHFKRAKELSGGNMASYYVAMANLSLSKKG